MRFRPGVQGALPLLFCSVLAAAPGPTFEKDVLPIFTAHCFACHGGTSMIGLDLRTAQSVMKGSHNGPVLVPGDSAESLLYQKVSAREMPPKAFTLDLSEAQIETIKGWIEAGAPHEKVQPLLAADQVERFNHQALPIFEAKCLACHGQEPAPGGLDLRTLEATLKGSENGPVVVEGASELSILIRMVSSGSMPPPVPDRPSPKRRSTTSGPGSIPPASDPISSPKSGRPSASRKRLPSPGRIGITGLSASLWPLRCLVSRTRGGSGLPSTPSSWPSWKRRVWVFPPRSRGRH